MSFTITYKNGHVGGNVGSDTLTITDSPLVLTNQTLGLTDSSSLDFTNASCDGIFVRAPLLTLIHLSKKKISLT